MKLFYLFGRLQFIVLSVCLLLVNIARAQTPPYYKGLGTSGNTIPMNTAGSHTQQIYLPTDFNSLPISGNITKIYFRNSSAGTSGVYTNFSVAFLQNSQTAFANSTFLTGFTNALSQSSISITGNAVAGGWYEIPLTTPFLYDNSKTLIVEIKYDSRTGGISGYTTTASGNKRLSIITAPGPATGNLSTIWGDFGMEVIPAGPCTSPPDPGIVAASSNPVCGLTNFTLSTSGGSTGSGLTYQWQSSPDSVNWTSIPSATASSFNTNQPATTFYRIQATCSGTTISSAGLKVVSPSLISGNYTINNAIPTGGSNFNSFNDAVNFIKCGINGPVKFTVAPGSGPYNEQVIINPIPGASANNTITFKGSLSTLQFNSTTSGQRAGITLDGADHIIIDSLVIDGTAGTYGWGVFFTNQADSNKISNCVINVSTSNTTATNHAPIVFSASYTSATTAGNNGNYDSIIGNTLNGGYYGVVLYGNSVATALSLNNLVTKNVINDVYAYGVYTLYQSGAVISRNDITRTSRNTSNTTAAGVYVSTGCLEILVEKNKVHNMFDAMSGNASTCYGLYAGASTSTAGQPVRLINNLVYNIGGNGPAYGIYNTSTPYMLAYHNTLALDGQAASTGTAYGFYQTATAAGVEFRNNIVYVTRSGSGVKRCVYFATTTSSIVSNQNVLVMNAGGGTDNKVGQYGTTSYTTLPDWQGANANAYDQQSVSADPIFSNPGAGEYLPGSSLVNNLGMGVGVLTDILDSTRSATTPDPGAYEFSTLTAGLNMGAEGLITPVTTAKGCYTNAETVTIRIRNSSTSTINFSTNPVTVITNVSGAANVTLSTTLNTGTLASDATMDVPMSQPLDMSAPGLYTFDANTVLAGDVNSVNDAMIPVNKTKIALSSGSVLASPNTYCVPSPLPNINLSSTGHDGYTSLLWKSAVSPSGNYTGISGATTVPFSISTGLTQTTYYKLYATCGIMIDSSAPAVVMYENPLVTGTTPGGRCGNGTVNLQATGNAGAALNWYQNATGGTSLYTGSSFTTPALTSNTTYYVSASSGSAAANVGMATALSTATSGAGTTNFGLVFDALSAFTLNSVVVYPLASSAGTTGTVTIDVINGSGTVLHTATVNVTGYPAASPVGQTVTLNFNIQPGTNLKLRPGSRSSGISGLLFEPSAPAPAGNYGYPFSVPGIVTINTSTNTAAPTNTARNDLYYYFYNWIVSTGCESGRTPVLARVDDCPMPVTLLNFAGEKQGNINKLQWKTTTEVNNAGFELERSADGKNFSKLAFVASKAENGNSNRAIDYVYYDERPLAGSGYYRLKQVDKDGKKSYSNIVLLKGDKVKEVMITSVYPNPAEREVNLIITSPGSEKIILIVTDITGKIVRQSALQLTAGDNLQKLSVTQLAPGTYFVKTLCANGCESAVQKFVRQ